MLQGCNDLMAGFFWIPWVAGNGLPVEFWNELILGPVNLPLPDNPFPSDSLNPGKIK